MKRILVTLAIILFAVTTASAFEVEKLYIEGNSGTFNTLEAPSSWGVDTLDNWNLNLHGKAVVLETGLGDIGLEGSTVYSVGDVLRNLPVEASVFVRPFKIPFIEVFYTNRGTTGRFNVDKSTLGFRVGKGF